MSSKDLYVVKRLWSLEILVVPLKDNCWWEKWSVIYTVLWRSRPYRKNSSGILLGEVNMKIKRKFFLGSPYPVSTPTCNVWGTGSRVRKVVWKRLLLYLHLFPIQGTRSGIPINHFLDPKLRSRDLVWTTRQRGELDKWGRVPPPRLLPCSL